MIFIKQPSVSLTLSPGSPCLSSLSTIMKMVNSASAGSSRPRTRSGSHIRLRSRVGLQRLCFRDDLWIEEEKKRQRRLTRDTSKRGTHPLEEQEEVSVMKMSSNAANTWPLFLLCHPCSLLKMNVFSVSSFVFIVICYPSFFHNFFILNTCQSLFYFACSLHHYDSYRSSGYWVFLV